jgi:hypothetical protein
MRVRLRAYFAKQALQNIRDNLAVHVLGLGTMISSLLIFGIFMLLYANVATWIHGWGNSLSFSVYLKDDISAYKRDKVDAFLRQLPGEKNLLYISKKDAMADLKETLGGDADLLERLAGNPLPASYEVFFPRADGHGLNPEAIEAALAKLDGVADVQMQRGMVAQFQPDYGYGKVRLFRRGGASVSLCYLYYDEYHQADHPSPKGGNRDSQAGGGHGLVYQNTLFAGRDYSRHSGGCSDAVDTVRRILVLCHQRDSIL